MEKLYLGTGIKYPLQIVGGALMLQSGNPLIEQSIITILNTPKGSKFFLPEYGSRLRELLFETNDDVLFDLLEVFIYEAITEWEKRAVFSKAEFTRENDVVFCTIFYSILPSNEVNSFIYPFYSNLKY
jgi:uncharacterized protein